MARGVLEQRSEAPTPERRRTAARAGRGPRRRWLVGGALALALTALAVYLVTGRGGGGGALATLQTADFHALAISPDDPSIVLSLPFAGAAFDAVVATLVLCTVADPARALAEVRRVLEPGGEFRFIEHVRADGWIGRVHDVITPIWRRIGAGCHPNRRTVEAIAAAGFEIVEPRARRLPAMPLILGVARPR